LIGVDRIEVGANSSSIVGVAVTQSGTADILNLYDGSTEVFSVADGGVLTITGKGLINNTSSTSDVGLRITNNATAAFSTSENMEGTTNRKLTPLMLRNSSTSANTETYLGFDAGHTSKAQWNVGIKKTGALQGDFIFNTRTGSSTSAERLRIAANGKVGIGTQIPSGKLEVADPGNVELLTLKRTTGNSGIFKVIIGGADPGTIFDATGVSDDFIFRPGGAEKLRITSAGTVGINTATPIGDFTVLTAGNGYFGIDGGGGKGAEFNVYHRDTKANTFKFANNGGVNELAQHYLMNASGKYLWYIGGTSTANEKMRLDNNGRLGIGTDNPATTLDVNGTVTATLFSGSGASLTGIVNANIAANAAIAGSKIDPNFGTQTLNAGLAYFTNHLNTTGNFALTGGNTQINFNRDSHSPNYSLRLTGSSYTTMNFRIKDETNSEDRFIIRHGGQIEIPGDVGIGHPVNFTTTNISKFGNYSTLHIKGPSNEGAAIRLQDNGDTADSDDFVIYKNYASAYLRVNGTDPLKFYMNGSTRVQVGSAGTVSIGDAATHSYSAHSEGDDLVIGGAGWRGMTIYGEGGGGVIQFADNGSNRIGQILYNHGDNSMDFRVNGNVTRLKIDSSGRLLLGHNTSTDDRDGYNSSLQVSGTSGDDTSISIGRWSNDQSSPALVFSKSRSTTIGSHSVLTGNEYLGAIQFQGDDGTNYHVGASIQARVEYEGAGNDDMPTRLLFNTNRDEANVTNRMIIHGRGNDYGVKYGGRVDILGYEGQNITGGSKTNVLNEQFLVCPSAADGYADSHTITFGQTKGNWESGTSSAYDTSYGLMWFFGGQYNSTRQLRAGIHYDHKGQERFKFWSSYGDIIFKTRSTSQGDYTAEECDQEPLRITDTNRVGINRGGTASVDETLDVDGGARFRSYVYIGDGFFFKSNAFGGNTNLDTGISINQGGRGGCGLLLASRNYNNGTGTSAGIYRIKWYYDGNNAPATHHMSGDNFISFGVSASNTLTINGGGGNQLYGIINVTA